MKDFRENIIYHDNHVIVAYKPPGMLSQKDKTGDDSILEHVKAFIKVEYNKPGNVFLGSVHRLDRPAEGLMVFAKTSKAHERLNKAFRDGAVSKVYRVLTSNIPNIQRGKLIHYLEKDHKRNIVKAFDTPGENRKKAILSYEVLSAVDGISLMEIHLETGRPHQIRVQLASIGCPVVGDLKYGNDKKTGDGSIRLMSYRLAFEHPVTKEYLTFEHLMPSEKKYWNKFAN